MAIIKFHIQKDIRRVSVNSETPKFKELRDLALTSFKQLSDQPFVFSYKDDEGDVISVSCEKEMEEALRFMKTQNKVVRFGIVVLPVKEENKKENKKELPKQSKDEIKVEKPKAPEKPKVPVPTHPVKEVVKNLVAENPFLEVKDQIVQLDAEIKKAPTQPIKKDEEKPNPSTKTETTPVTETPQVITPVPDINSNNATNVQPIPVPDAKKKPNPKAIEVAKLKEQQLAAKREEKEKARKDREAKKNPPKVSEEKKIEIPVTATQETPESEVKPLIPLKLVTATTATEQAETKQVEKVDTPVTKPEEQKGAEITPFESKMKQLDEMGFMNKEKNLELLVKTNGDILEAVKLLLE